MRRSSTLLIAVPFLLLGCGTSPSEHDTPDGKLEAAAGAVTELRADQPAIDYFLARSRGVLVFPSVTRLATVVGFAHGDCVLVEREGNSWAAPRFMTGSGISVGAQAGIETGKVLVVIMNQRLLGTLEKGLIDFGGGFGISMGPADLKAVASAQSFQDAYVFRDSGGVFLGVSLDSAVIHDDRARNDTFRRGPRRGEAEMKLQQSLAVTEAPR